MKKILFAIAIVLTIGMTASAQGKRDGFFSTYGNNDIYENRSYDTPALPGEGYATGTILGNQQAVPLGSGLLILTALGAGYALTRKRNEE